MKELIDSNLENEWEKKLVQHGLGKITKREKIPAILPQKPFEEFWFDLNSEMKGLFDRFFLLPRNTQETILSLIKINRDSEMSSLELLSRLNLLIAKGEEFEEIADIEGDKHYQPKNPHEQEEEQDRARRKSIDEFIRNAEKIIQKDKLDTDEPGGPRNIN